MLRLTLSISAIVGLIALSGCAGQPLPPRAKTIRGPEELRVTRQPLTPLQTRTDRDAELTVPGANGKSASLFLDEHEAIQLKAADRGQAFEIRYWFQEDLHGDVRIGRAELASIRDGQTVIVDRARCERHDQVMSRRKVGILYGFPMLEFAEALAHDFPHAAVRLGGCMGIDGSLEAPAYVCHVCDAAYEAWTPTSPK